MTTRQYARLLSEWIASIGLDPHLFGTHSLRRTKATLIYRRTAICEPFSYCSATLRSRAPSDISALRSMTLNEMDSFLLSSRHVGRTAEPPLGTPFLV